MKVILLRFGELYLKGNNRNIFEHTLINNVKKKLAGEKFVFSKTYGRYVVSGYEEKNEKKIIKLLKQVFGLYSLSKAEEVEASVESIVNVAKNVRIGNATFKVHVKRADKKFPISSMDFAKDLGGVILDNNPNAKVDLYNPQYEFNVDIRLNGRAYIYSEIIKCQGGLPLGTGGRGLLLLSGGIDSPVAGYLISKRGIEIDALHFHSYPYTSELAKEKVISLAKEIAPFTGEINLHIISFTKVQETLHMNCAEQYMITLMRRIMMRVAERLCEKYSLGAIITGESLGQVASQTMQSMTVTGEVVKQVPIFRPCIALDKEDIIKVANEIGTYNTSILPYEDCCTVFLPKNPVIKPTRERCLREESKINIDALIEECLASEEIIKINF